MKNLDHLLSIMIQDPVLHAKWLNTLSYLENCGARKIAASEHPTKVKKEMLKHAEEEFRHAHHLKKQIAKLSDYSLWNILGGFATYHYLKRLDVRASRYLMTSFDANIEVSRRSYVFVTYAIELRAQKLYLAYDEKLKKYNSQVTVMPILYEEEEHLQEMKNAIAHIEKGDEIAQYVCSYERELYDNWLQTIAKELEAISFEGKDLLHELFEM